MSAQSSILPGGHFPLFTFPSFAENDPSSALAVLGAWSDEDILELHALARTELFTALADPRLHSLEEHHAVVALIVYDKAELIAHLRVAGNQSKSCKSGL